jgi:hypothetical protein
MLDKIPQFWRTPGTEDPGVVAGKPPHRPLDNQKMTTLDPVMPVASKVIASGLMRTTSPSRC